MKRDEGRSEGEEEEEEGKKGEAVRCWVLEGQEC